MIETLKDLAIAYRTPYAWPGGYQLHLVLADGACLCHTCFRDNYALVAGDLRATGCNPGWKPYDLDTNWEDPDLYCDHCGSHIPPEYPAD